MQHWQFKRIFGESHIKAVVVTSVGEAGSVTEESRPGVSEVPHESPRCIQAADDTCRGVTRRPHERARRHNKRARLQL